MKRTEKRTEDTQAIIHRTHVLEKPSFTIAFSKKHQSTLSYALDRSNLYAQKFVLADEEFWMANKHSKAIKALSVINLPGTKAL